MSRSVTSSADPVIASALHLRLPLIVPYRLAFGEQRQFDTILVRIEGSDGRIGFGEATILPGYTDETVEGAWELASGIAARARSVGSVRVLAEQALATAPFTATAFLSALDLLEDHPVLSLAGRFPLLGTVNGKASAPAELEAEIEALIGAGHRTLKVKIGFEVVGDLAQIEAVRRYAAGRARLRIDGNQGYTIEEARAFLARLDPDAIELMEQPCPAGDWEAACAVKSAAPVPVMLDESIYGLQDIERAAHLGCADFIKLKLMKFGSIDRMQHGLRLIRECGMTPVLGNGVASDLGCWMEASAGLGLVDTAGEMNGFTKTRTQLLSPPLRLEGADLVLTGKRPALDEAALSSAVVVRTA